MLVRLGLYLWSHLVCPGFYCSFLVAAALIGVSEKPLSLLPRPVLCMAGCLLSYFVAPTMGLS